MLSPRIFLPLALITSASASAQVCPAEDFASPNHSFGDATELAYTQASLLAPLALTTSEPRDYFFIDVPSGGTCTIELEFSDAQADLDLHLYDSNFVEIARSETTTDDELLTFDNSGVAPVRFYLQALNFDAIFVGGGCGDYVLRLTGSGTACDGDDMFENFDDCSSTLSLQGSFAQNTPVDLILRPGDPDWFDVQLQPQERLNLTINFLHTTADLDLRSFELTPGGCGAALDSSASSSNSESIQITNNTGNFQDVAIEAYWSGASSGATCSQYTLSYEIVPGNGPCGSDDVYEDNDNACAATPLPLGVYPNLRVGDGDPDFYSVDVPGGTTGVFALDFENFLGDIDLYLYAGSDCLNLTQIASSFSTNDYEEVRVDLAGLPATTVYVEVRFFPTDGGCNSYQLTIAENLDAAVGQVYCEGATNSTGDSSLALGQGSSSIAANDLTLRCIDVPAQTFGFFITSRTSGFVPNPAGSAGNLCILGDIGRYVGPGQIQNSGASNEVALSIDLAAIPTPTGFVAVAPGETWYFQYWHRDSSPGGPTSNFSSGLRIWFG